VSVCVCVSNSGVLVFQVQCRFMPFKKRLLAKQFAFDAVFLESINSVFIKSVLASMQVCHTMCWLRAISHAWITAEIMLFVLLCGALFSGLHALR